MGFSAYQRQASVALSKSARFASELVMVFGLVHAPVGGSEKLICVRAVFRKRGFAHAHGEYFFAAMQSPGLCRDLGKSACLSPHGVDRLARQHNHEFVAAHARHIVVLATILLKYLSNGPQPLLPLAV